MCTLTWEFALDQYTVLFNRDERRERAPAEPIQITGAGNERRCIHARDGARGGTWMVVNAAGVTTCLLNRFDVGSADACSGEFESRGWLVMTLRDSSGWSETQMRIQELDLKRYPAFHLFQFDPIQGVHSLSWDGSEVQLHEHSWRCDAAVSSSSFENDRIVAARRASFAAQVRATERQQRLCELEYFHRNRIPGQGAESVNMVREDARTVSHSRVDVDAQHVRFAYSEAMGEGPEFSAPRCLSLQRESTQWST